MFLAALTICAASDARDRLVPGPALTALVAAGAIVGITAHGPFRTLAGSVLALPAMVAQRRGTAGPADAAAILGIGAAYGYSRGSLVMLAACASALLATVPALLTSGTTSLPGLLAHRARRIAFLPHALIGVIIAGGTP